MSPRTYSHLSLSGSGIKTTTAVTVTGTLSLEKTGYLLATSGLMVRISRLININGGVSFMDIDKEFYKPEITFGISFNLKKKD